jgi:beta-glucosidase
MDYKDPSKPIPARANDLLARMTLAEKVAQLVQPLQFKELLSPADVIAQFNATGLGAWYLTRTKLTPPTGGAAAMVQARNEIQRGFVEGTRLGIPVSMITETLHSGGPDCTIFPMPINYACSWNESALEMSARVLARESRAIGTDRGFSPVINLFPDARYGRVQEGFSEDPWLTKVMGAAHLRGLQGGAMGGPETYLNNFTHALVATVKHYAAYGMTAGGIDGSPADLSEQKLRELYLSPWEYLAQGRGLRSVMAAQNMVNGRPMHANHRLLTEVLREEWGVAHALVESDGPDCIGALGDGFHVAATKEEVAVLSLESGMDMDLGGVAFPLLNHAVATNKTTEKAVDRAVYNVLVSKFAAGLFEYPYTDEARVEHLDGAANRVMARYSTLLVAYPTHCTHQWVDGQGGCRAIDGAADQSPCSSYNCHRTSSCCY